MITTRDRLILDQLVYEDLTGLLEATSYEDDDWRDVINNVINNFNNDSNGGEQITRNEIMTTLGKVELVHSEAESLGFYAAAFKDNVSEEMVIAIRGSHPMSEITDGISDSYYDWVETNLIELPLPYYKVDDFDRFQMAIRFYNNASEYHTGNDFSVTGHSMGGALAQRLAVYLIDEGENVICETFNAPGMLHSLSDEMQLKASNGVYDSIVNYVNEDDSVGTMDLMAYKLFNSGNLNPAALALNVAIGLSGIMEYISSSTSGVPFVGGAYVIDNILGDVIGSLTSHFKKSNYIEEFMKHVGKTYYVQDQQGVSSEETVKFIHGGKEYDVVVNNYSADTHGLFNFLRATNTGKFRAVAGVDMALTFGTDNIIGTEGSDTFYLKAGNDKINANSGNDIIYGGDGDDTITGWTGNDILDGGLDSDHYIYKKGHDHDTINDYSAPGDTETDRITIEGYSSDEIYLQKGEDQYENDLVIKFSGNDDDSITLNNYYSSPNVNLIDKVNTTIEEITGFVSSENAIKKASDIHEGYSDDVNAEFVTEGGATRDLIIGNINRDILKGHDGQDTLYGEEGNDDLYGGSESDYLYGGKGNDKLYGGAGDDELIGGEGIDLLNGNLGNDTLHIDVRGDNASSESDGILKKEYAFGGSGNDKYIIDSILDSDVVIDDTLFNGSDVDTIEMNVYYKKDLIFAKGTNDSLLIYSLNNAKNMLIKTEIRGGFFSESHDGSSFRRAKSIKSIKLLDGTIDLDTIKKYRIEDATKAENFTVLKGDNHLVINAAFTVEEIFESLRTDSNAQGIDDMRDPYLQLKKNSANPSMSAQENKLVDTVSTSIASMNSGQINKNDTILMRDYSLSDISTRQSGDNLILSVGIDSGAHDIVTIEDYYTVGTSVQYVGLIGDETYVSVNSSTHSNHSYKLI